MVDILDSVKSRILKLNKIIMEKESALHEAPDGLVNIAKTATRTQFYYKENSSDKNKRYLRKDEKELIKKLCQKDYDEKVLAAAKKEKEYLEIFVKKYPRKICESLFDELINERKKYVDPVEFPEEVFVYNWEKELYVKKGFAEGAPEHYTQRGERVRSKSEVMIANALYMRKIPYKYECPLNLKGYGIVYPDFTILNVKTRKEIYWEHMGKMDNPEYVEKALRKIESYEKNDLFSGEKMLLTFESTRHPLNSRTIERMILKYLI